MNKYIFLKYEMITKICKYWQRYRYNYIDVDIDIY